MQRVMIIGGPGSGKSTLARRIGERLGIDVTHLDAIYWKPGWVFSEHDEVADRLVDLYARDTWVIEGNYSATWKERRDRADALVFLDVPTWLRFWRVLRRSITSWGQVREDMAEGCPEQIDVGFFRFVLGYGLRRRKKALRFLASAPDHVATYRLRSLAQTDAFIAGIGDQT